MTRSSSSSFCTELTNISLTNATSTDLMNQANHDLTATSRWLVDVAGRAFLWFGGPC